MYYHPYLSWNQRQYYHPHSRTIFVNPYFCSNLLSYPGSYENLSPGYNNSLREGIHLGNPESLIYWTPQTGGHGAYRGVPTKWVPLGWERNQLGYPIVPEQDRTDRIGVQIPGGGPAECPRQH